MSNVPDKWDIVHAACERMAAWYAEGRFMPGYIPKFGKPYIALLLGLSNHSSLPESFRESFSDRFFREYEAGGFTFAEDICGPNGWTMLQYYIARANESLESL